MEEEEAVEVVAEDEVAEKVEVAAIGEDPGKRANLRVAVEVTGEVEGRVEEMPLLMFWMRHHFHL